jgi:hypothetical protein
MEKSNSGPALLTRLKLSKLLKLSGAAFFLGAASAVFWAFAAEAGEFTTVGEDLVKADMGLVSLRYSSTVYAYLDYKEEDSADKAYNQHYARDHLPIVLSVWEDRTEETAALYKSLVSGDVASGGATSGDILAFSFVVSIDQAKFDAQNPGYRSAYFDFEEEYKKRAARLQNDALETLRGNEIQTNMSLKTRAPDMLKLNVSSLATLGYRQALQAGGQTINFMNQGLVLLRMDMLRQTEAETFFALDEMQADSDVQAAFEGGTRWRFQSTGKNY